MQTKLEALLHALKHTHFEHMCALYLHSIGFKTTARYYALNILEELDSPNEVRVEFMTQRYITILSMTSTTCLQYYVDRGTGIMYLFGPSSQEKVESACIDVLQGKISMTHIL